MALNWVLIAFAILVLCLISLLILRKRRRKRLKIQGHLEHPGGFLKYHRNTDIRIKRALKLKAAKNEKSLSLAVLDFKGDIKASERKSLSHLIDEIILNKEKFAEVVLKVESPGGSVTEYGHVYGEVSRLRANKIPLTVCIDSVAASGGYLMSLPADKILAAPFAMVGSIGVVSFVPNIRKLLEKLLIEPRTFTAGDFKRTVTLTDEAKPEEVARYKEQLQLIHDQFKKALKTYRPNVDLAVVATGEAWLAATTLEKNLGLVDELRISADYLLEKNREYDLVEFIEKEPKKALRALLDKFGAKILAKISEVLSDKAV